MSGFPVFLCCTLVFILWLRYEIRKGNRKNDTSNDSFWELEHKASFSRRKDLSDLNYITIPTDRLPFSTVPADVLKNDPENEADNALCTGDTPETPAALSPLAEVEAQILKLRSKKIVNLTGISNTQLKLDYGAANLEELSEYDANFTLLIRYLNSWGTLLHQEGRDEDAIQVLSYAIEEGSDISSTFLLLGKLYQKREEPARINKLLDRAERLTSLSKTRIVRELTLLLNDVPPS